MSGPLHVFSVLNANVVKKRIQSGLTAPHIFLVFGQRAKWRKLCLLTEASEPQLCSTDPCKHFQIRCCVKQVTGTTTISGNPIDRLNPCLFSLVVFFKMQAKLDLLQQFAEAVLFHYSFVFHASSSSPPPMYSAQPNALFDIRKATKNTAKGFISILICLRD